jgi:hypothetical protein
MRKTVLSLLLLLVTGAIFAQTISFSEDFETTPLGVSSSGSASWARSSILQVSGIYSDSVTFTASGDSAYLTTNSFSTSSKQFVKLEFDQICKLEYFDGGIIEVSTDNGATWTQLTGSQYLGNAQFATIGNKFNSISYATIWDPSNNFAQPTNSWWQHEIFDISSLAGNSSQVKVRFYAFDGNGNANAGNYGWLIDNIKVYSSSTELTPPQLVMNAPILKDSVPGTGPFEVSATITDTSGIAGAWVIYTINSTTDSVAMVSQANDVYKGSIPQQLYNTNITYHVKALDSSSNNNEVKSMNYTFYNYQQPKIVQVGTGTSNTYYAPVYNYTTTSADVYSDHVSIFTAADMQGNYGVIDKIRWEKSNANNYSGTASIEIYFKETSDNSVPTTSADFQTALAGATLVYSNSAFTLPASAGDIDIPTTQNQFVYTGNDNLMMFVRWHRTGTLSNNYIRWNYTYSSGNALTFKGSTANPASSAGSGYRPNTKFWLTDPITTYDVEMKSIDSPQPVVLSTTSTPIEVKIANNGTANLISSHIDYEIDGVSQSTYNWTGNLPQYFSTPSLTIGNHNFTNGSHNIKVWASLPNDSADQYTYNDTLMMNFFTCSSILAGNYTVGGTAADFQTIGDAIDVLSHCGVNAPVTFKINPGIYDEYIYLNDSIPGVDSNNTVTFTSTTGDYHDVVIKQTDGNISTVVDLVSAHDIIIKDLTIDGSSPNISKTINMTLGANHNRIDGCKVMAPISSTYGVYPIYIYGEDVNYNDIYNNTITGGYYSVYVKGSYNQKSTNNNLIGNTVTDFNAYSIYYYYSANAIIKNNNIVKYDNGSTSTQAGIYVYRNNNVEITHNNIYLEATSAVYGMYVYYCDNTLSDTNLIANNMVVCAGNSSSTAFRALYVSSTKNTNFYNNTFANYSGTSATEVCYITGTTVNINFKNNIFANFASSYAVEKSTSSSSVVNSMDHNLFYTNGGQIMKWGSTVVATSSGISGIISTTGMNTNSIVADPKFYTIKNAHSFSPDVNGAGVPLVNVTDDIDGDVRDINTPDIGADEFVISSIDAGVVDIIDPIAIDTQSRVLNVKAIVSNFGSDTLTSMNINYILNNNSPVTYSWTGSLAPSLSDTISIASITLPVLNNSLKVFTVLTGDTLNYNDTTEIQFYGLPLIEAELASIDEPNDGCEKGTAENVTVTINNNGLQDIESGLSVSYRVNGGSAVTETVTDTVLSGASISYTFNATVDMLVGYNDSTFNFEAWVSHSADPISLNDTTMSSAISKGLLPDPIVGDTTINYGSSVVLSASSVDPVKWYSNDSTSTELASGYSYTTPQLFDTTTYYAQANSNIPPQTVYVGTASTTFGPWDNSLYGGGMGSGRYQVLYTSADLIAAGLSAGVIESIAFDVASAPNSISQFDIYMGLTSDASLTSGFINSGLTLVKSSPFTGQAGWNTHTLTTPFYWDGSSNLLIQVCAAGISYTAPPLKYTTTSYVSYIGAAGVGVTCSAASGISNTQRPNIKIVTQSALGCSSNRVPVTVNVPLPAIDGKVSAITSPVSSCGIGTSTVSVDIVNKGTNTIPAGFTITYRVNNGAYVTPETVNDSIEYGDTLNYTFNTTASMPSGPNGTNYVITSKLIIPSDTYSPNDSLSSDSIFSKYTPTNPVVSNISVNYGDSATLSSVNNDTLYWFLDSLETNLIGVGNNTKTDPLYDTTKVWVYSRKTISQSNYDIGNGTAVSSTTDPSPYGSGQYGAKHQFIVLASELSAMGMIQGNISSIAFDVSSVKGNALNNYTISIGMTDASDLNRQYFIGNLTTVYSTSAYTESFGWNEHQFTTPFYWDGVSNIVIETAFKNSSSTPLVGVKYTSTSFVSTAQARGYTTFDVADTTINTTFSMRPNIRFSELGLGLCKSDLMSMQVNVTNFATVDLGLTSVAVPIDSASSVIASPVKVVLKNWGLNTVTSATINWSENGVSQTPYTWTGSLAHGDIDTVTVDATHNFMGGITSLKAWVSTTGDITTTNDTTSSMLKVCMSGTYTVGNTNDNFVDVNDAIYNLNQVGICGPVVISIDSGSYYGPWTIPSIDGSSTVNTVTFKSTDNDSTYVNLSALTSQQTNYVIRLQGASNIAFDHLNVFSNGSTYSNVFVFENDVNNVSIQNSILSSAMVTTGTASNIYANNEGVSNLNVENNVINNGYRSIYLYGYSSDIENINITNNHFNNIGYYGIYLYYSDSNNISNNIIVSPVTNSTYYGIYVYNANEPTYIKNNKITLSPTSSARGIYVKTINSSNNRGIIANNMISILTGTGISRGIYSYASTYNDIVYNTVSIENGSSTSSAFYISSGSNNVVENNIFSNNYGYSIYVGSLGAISGFDYNDVYTDTLTSTNYAYWGGGTIADLATLKQQDVTKNVHTINEDPLFISSTNLQSQQILLYNAGTPISSVTTDINGATRSTTAPSMGAIEFTPPSIDLGIIEMPYPYDSDCGFTSSEPITINIQNYGLNDINFSNTSATITVTIAGVNPDTITYTINSGVLLSTNDTDIVVTSSYDMSQMGEYTFNANVAIANDGNNLNDNLTPKTLFAYPNINSFPFVADFETGNNQIFKESVSTNSEISVDALAASSGNFGLHFEGGAYSGWTTPSDVDAAFANTTHVATLTTCNVDASALNVLSMKLDLKQTAYNTSYVNTNSWFRIRLTDANGTYYVHDINGDSVFRPLTPNSDPFVTHTFILDQWAGQSFSISYEAANKYEYGHYNTAGDNVYIDNITFWSPSSTDVSATAVVVDKHFGQVGQAINVKMVVENYGSDTVSTIPVGLVHSGMLVSTDTIFSSIAPSQVDTFTFSQIITLTSGVQTLEAYVAYPLDSLNSNDTASISVKGMDNLSIDYEDDFESMDYWFGTGTYSQWELGTPNQLDINAAHSGTNAWMTKLNANYQNGADEYIYSPYFTIPTNADTATLEFYQYMVVQTGHAWGQVEYSTDGITWSSIGYMGSPNSTNWYNYVANGVHVFSYSGNQWLQSSIALDPIVFNTGQSFQIRFKFHSNNSGTPDEGWAIDDVSIKVPKLAIDAGVAGILSPNNTIMVGDSAMVSVEIKNFGTDTLYSIPVEFTDGTSLISETWTGTLLPDSVVAYNFAAKYSSMVPGQVQFCSSTNLVGDNKNSNDETCMSMTINPAAKDVGVSSITSPSGQSTIGGNISVEIVISNYGSDTIYNIPVTYTLSGVNIANETYTGIILPGDSDTYAFTTTYVSPVGTYYLCASTNLVGDAVPANDNKCEAVVGTSLTQATNSLFAVSQNKPNPANGITKIEYFIPTPGKVNFTLISVTGAVVEHVESHLDSGNHNLILNSNKLQPGIYYYTFEFKGERISKKMVVL